MGCSSCGNKTQPQPNVLRTTTHAPVINQGPCEYTNEVLQIWADKLKWFKDSGKYVKYNVKSATLNKYLGIVLTSLNVNNKCTYRSLLDSEIKTLITFITGVQNV